MDEKIIYYATSNATKISRLQRLVHFFDENIKIEKIPNLVEIVEDEETLEENSAKKLSPYIGKKYDKPIISLDTAMSIKDSNLDPLKPKRNVLEQKGLKEKDLSIEEIGSLMNDFYIQLAKKNGGEIEFYFEDCFSILNNKTKRISTKSVKRYSILKDKACGIIDNFMPIRNLYIDKKTLKYEAQKNDEDFQLEFEDEILLLKEMFGNLLGVTYAV